jgi:hypothetical protein
MPDSSDKGAAIEAVKKELTWRLPGANIKAIQSAKGAQDFWDLLGVFQSNPPARGTKEMLVAYSTMPWLRAAVDKIGSSVASMTWRVFVKAEVNDDGKREPKRARQIQFMNHNQRKAALFKLKQAEQLVEIEEHPIIEAIYATGPTFTGHTTRELSQKWLDLVGEAFWIKERNAAGMPVNFIPVPPHWVTNTPRSAEQNYFEIQTPSGGLDQVKPEDMIWFYHPDPHNPYERGSGMGVTLGDELETDEYASKFMKQFFYNSARPDFLISSSELRKEDTTRLEKRWVDKLRGWRRSFLPFFMNREVKVHQLGTDYSHLSMLDLRKHQRDAIIQVYGVPPEVLGIVEASNRATSEVAEYLYARWVLVPRLEFLRTNLQHRLVYEYDDRLILDYDSPVAQDKEHILNVATISPWALMIDEWREMMGKLALPDGQGQVFMKPLNYEAVLPEDLGEPYSQQEEEGDGSNDDGGSSDVPPDDDGGDEGEEVSAVEESVRHVWPELVANVVARQRVTPRVGTRKSQVAAVLSQALVEIADASRKTSGVIEDLVGAGDLDVAYGHILGQTAAIELVPVIAKLTSVYVLAAEQAKSNLMLYVTDKGDVDALEPLYELSAAERTAEESIVAAIRDTLEAVAAESADESAETITFYMIDSIGVGASDASQFVALEGGGDDVVAMVENFVEQMADHAIVHMCNCAQEALWSEAVRVGVLDSDAVARIWITRLGCRSCDECSGMDGVTTDIDMAWDLPDGDTVVTPTKAHPECHCTEQLVRKEVQREAAE